MLYLISKVFSILVDLRNICFWVINNDLVISFLQIIKTEIYILNYSVYINFNHLLDTNRNDFMENCCFKKFDTEDSVQCDLIDG